MKKEFKILIIGIVILVSLILFGVYNQIQIEERIDAMLVGEFVGCGTYQIYFLNNGTTLDNGYILRMSNVTVVVGGDLKNSFMSSQTEFWFSSLGHYTIEGLNSHINKTLKIHYHSNMKDKTELDLVEIWI